MPRYEDNAVGNYQRAGDRLNNVEQHVDSIADQIALAQADLLRSPSATCTPSSRTPAGSRPHSKPATTPTRRRPHAADQHRSGAA